MVQWIPGAAVGLLLIPALLAGCLGGDASVDPTEDDRDPQWRVRDVDVKTYGGWLCKTRLPTTGADCIEHVLEFSEVKCDPHQMALVEHGFSRRFDEWDGPEEDTYVFCLYTLKWYFQAETPFPFSRASVSVEMDDERVRETCNTGLDRTCSMDGEIKGTIEIHRTHNEYLQEARQQATMEGFVYPYPGSLPKDVGQASGSVETELKLFI